MCINNSWRWCKMASDWLTPSPGTPGEGGGEGVSSFVIESGFGFRHSDFATHDSASIVAPHSGHLCGVPLMSYPHTLHFLLDRSRLFHHALPNQNPIPAKHKTKNQCGTFTYLPPYSGQIASVPNPSNRLLYLVP